MALKKVALRKLEDGIPNQALREIKALQEIEDNPYVSVCNSWNDILVLHIFAETAPVGSLTISSVNPDPLNLWAWLCAAQ